MRERNTALMKACPVPSTDSNPLPISLISYLPTCTMGGTIYAVQ